MPSQSRRRGAKSSRAGRRRRGKQSGQGRNEQASPKSNDRVQDGRVSKNESSPKRSSQELAAVLSADGAANASSSFESQPGHVQSSPVTPNATHATAQGTPSEDEFDENFVRDIAMVCAGLTSTRAKDHQMFGLPAPPTLSMADVDDIVRGGWDKVKQTVDGILMGMQHDMDTIHPLYHEKRQKYLDYLEARKKQDAKVAALQAKSDELKAQAEELEKLIAERKARVEDRERRLEKMLAEQKALLDDRQNRLERQS
ncbi:hypothetical protein F5B20DRAFT_583325 [Whalleya microplaca]|nr:hypothetical protein F5B20DRAFT_583325 [Whalleya microplaca]